MSTVEATKSSESAVTTLATVIDRAAEWGLNGPLSISLAVVYAAMFACWIPQYLTWPWWNDPDHLATFAMSWDAGLLPYRDLPSFQFPGGYYLYWAVGKTFGWGKTAPIYAVDASLLIALGFAMAGWSRARFGRALPGLIGYGFFLFYYLNLGYDLIAERDWHAALLAVIGLFAPGGFPGRAGRILSALLFAAALATRPHVGLFIPAYWLAIDESARPTGESWRLSMKAVLEWSAWLVGFVLLAFTPLIVAGVLDDFVLGLREAAPGGRYSRLSSGAVIARLCYQAIGRQHVFLAVAAVVIMTVAFRRERLRLIITWLVALVGAWFYRPLSPIDHAYLAHTLALVSCVISALLVGLILEPRGWSWTFKLALLALVLAVELPAWPHFATVGPSLSALSHPAPFAFPENPPDAGKPFLFDWTEYRDTVAYLRRTVPHDVRIANALRAFPAINGPVGRLPAFPAESLAWLKFFRNRPDLVDAYLHRLQATPHSVVVWRPTDATHDREFLPERLANYLSSAYEPEAKFGSIEVWKRRAGW